jgi:hypothetical protein
MNTKMDGEAASQRETKNVQQVTDEKLQLVMEATGAEVTVALYFLTEAQGDTHVAIRDYLELQAESLREQAVSYASPISEITFLRSPPPPRYESHQSNSETDVEYCNIRDDDSADSFDIPEFPPGELPKT